MNSKYTSNKSGFTLIELLVVIAIIAILAAILFPVFAQAREKARQISCASNMKQIDLALIMYTEDYDETYPTADSIGYYLNPAATLYSGQNNWTVTVLPYIKSNGVFACPDDALGNTIAAGGAGIDESYATNGLYDPYINSTAGPGCEGVICDEFPISGTQQILPVVTNAGVNQPANVIALAEVHSSDLAAHNDTYTPDTIKANQSAGNGNVITDDRYDYFQSLPAPGGGCTFMTNSCTSTYPWTPGAGAVSVHSNGQANFAFCDGHVKAMRPSATVANSNTTGPNYYQLGLYDFGAPNDNTPSMWVRQHN